MNDINQSQKGIVAGIGELLWDVLPEGKKMGGAPANFAYHISQFGLPGYAISAVGNDRSGNELKELLKSKHLLSAIETVPYPTGTVTVQLDGSGIPTYDIRKNVAWDNIPFTERLQRLAADASAVCFGSLAQRNAVSRHTIHRFIEAVPDSALKIFDINLRQNFYSPEIITDSLRRCNILKINDEELIVLSRMFGYDAADIQATCRTLLGRYDLSILILTCGTNGSYVFTPDAESFVDTPHVRVADTVGAGDSFTAAFTAATLRGKSIAEAHRLAVEVSAFVCTCDGAMPALPANLLLH